MKELIKVTERNGKQAVSARELHKFVNRETRWDIWIKRMLDYNFTQDVDYQCLNKNVPMPNGGYKSVLEDIVLTMDTAKEIAMIQNNDKGKQARQYFIECEKKLNKPRTQVELLLQSAQLLAEMERKQLALESRVEAIESRPEVNGDIQHFSIMGYCRNVNKQVSLNEAKVLGQKCSRLCSQMGFQTGKVPDPRFGTVKTYPLIVLEEIIGG